MDGKPFVFDDGGRAGTSHSQNRNSVLTTGPVHSSMVHWSLDDGPRDDNYWFRSRGLSLFQSRYYAGKYAGSEGKAMMSEGIQLSNGAPILIKSLPVIDIMWKEEEKGKIPYEVAVLRRIRCLPGVIHLLDTFMFYKSYIMVLEKPKCALNIQMFVHERGFFPEFEAKQWFVQLVKVVLNCYHAGVYHGNITPMNVSIDFSKHLILLTDFSHAILDQPIGIYDICESRPHGSWQPPSRVTFFQESHTVFSLGVVLYSMLIGEYSMCSPEKSIQRLFSSITISLPCKSVINACLSVHEINRPTLHGILEHPWVKLSYNDVPPVPALEPI